MEPNDAGLLDLTDANGAQVPFTARRVLGTWVVNLPGNDPIDVGYLTTDGVERILKAMQLVYAVAESDGYKHGLRKGIAAAREVTINDFSPAVLDRILADVNAHRAGSGGAD